MALMINDDCINCGACAVECSTDAIYEPDEKYSINGKIYSAISDDHYYIVEDLCNKCFGLNVIKCISICPMNAIKEY